MDIGRGPHECIVKTSRSAAARVTLGYGGDGGSTGGEITAPIGPSRRRRRRPWYAHCTGDNDRCTADRSDLTTRLFGVTLYPGKSLVGQLQPAGGRLFSSPRVGIVYYHHLG